MKRELPAMLTPNITNQELFDYITHFIYKQGRSSLANIAKAGGPTGINCAYRGADGLMCAVGCIIPDKFYRRDLEGDRIGGIISKSIDLQGEKKFWSTLNKHLELLDELQNAHDSMDGRATIGENRNFLLRQFLRVARNNALEFDQKDYTTT